MEDISWPSFKPGVGNLVAFKRHIQTQQSSTGHPHV